MAHPLLVSTSLMIVQRMTSLATFFMLLGLVSFVHFRREVPRKPIAAAIGISSSIVLGTLLATASKEIGVLLPLMALLVDCLLVQYEGLSLPRWYTRVWRPFFLWLPLIVVLAYIFAIWPRIIASYGYREFDLAQRLLTEGRVLWDYARLVVFPVRSQLSPFADDYLLSLGWLSPVTTLLSWTAWGGLLFGGWLLRKRWPLLAFSLFWFLGGHVLESSVFSLEIYFAHRNYLPLVGPAIAFVLALGHLPSHLQRLAVLAFVIYGLLLLLVLRETTLIWGQPHIAAKLWLQEHPLSIRALQYQSQRYVELGDIRGAWESVVSASRRMPANTALTMQTLQLGCGQEERGAYKRRIQEALPRLPSGTRNYAAVESLDRLVYRFLNSDCAEIEASELHALTDALIANPMYQKDPTAMFGLYLQKARLYDAQGSVPETLSSLEQAYGYKRDLQAGILHAGVLIRERRWQEALAVLEQLKADSPRNPFVSRRWQEEISGVQDYMQEEMKRTGVEGKQ